VSLRGSSGRLTASARNRVTGIARYRYVEAFEAMCDVGMSEAGHEIDVVGMAVERPHGYTPHQRNAFECRQQLVARCG
jgi:hypothetical protein